MESDTSRQIWEEVDRILAAVHLADYEAFRELARRGSTLASNLGRQLEVVASLNKDDLVALLHQKSQSEQEQTLRLLIGLNGALPQIAPILIKVAQKFPQNLGGRRKSFEDPNEMRLVCEVVADRIYKGDGEAKAKRFAAKEFDVSYQTIHRIWEKRAEIREQTFEEFIAPFIAALRGDGANLIPELASLTLCGNAPAPSPSVLEEEKQQDLSASDCKIEDK